MELVNENLKLHVHGCTIFMQDGAPYHRSNVATEFQTKSKISVLEWPGNSQNLWTIIKDKVTYKQSSSAENLGQAIKEVWVTEITQE